MALAAVAVVPAESELLLVVSPGYVPADESLGALPEPSQAHAALARDLAAQNAVHWTATWSTRRAGRLLLRATCATTDRVCRGRVTVAIAGRRVAVRPYRTSARHPTAGLHIDVPRARRGARRVALVVRASLPTFPAQTVTLTTPTTRR